MQAPPPQQASTGLAYTLGAKFMAEVIGTMCGVYFGDSVVANALLPHAKGQSMGNGWICFGYGLAFFFPGLWFSHISSRFNPAFCLNDWILGSLSFKEFLVLSIGDIVGAFLGAVLVWLHWVPHFKTVPEPPSLNPSDNLLRKRDALPENAINYASYATRPQLQQLPGTLRRRKGGGAGGVVGAGGVIGAGGVKPSPSTIMEEETSDDEGHAKRFGYGVLDLARAWVADLKYYTVEPDRFRQYPETAPEVEAVAEAESVRPARTGSASEVHIQMGIDTSHELDGTSNASSRRQTYAKTKSISRSAMMNQFQNEHLQMELKQSALPGIFYTAGLAPAILAAQKTSLPNSQRSSTEGADSVPRSNRTSWETAHSGHGRYGRTPSGGGFGRTSGQVPKEPSPTSADLDHAPTGRSIHTIQEGQEEEGDSAPLPTFNGNGEEGEEEEEEEEEGHSPIHVDGVDILGGLGIDTDALQRLPTNHSTTAPHGSNNTLESALHLIATADSAGGPTIATSPSHQGPSLNEWAAATEWADYISPFSAPAIQSGVEMDHSPSSEPGSEAKAKRKGAARFRSGPSPSFRPRATMGSMMSGLPNGLGQIDTLTGVTSDGGKGDTLKMSELQEGMDAAANLVYDQEKERVMAVYEGAIIADQNVKLSVFTTRPAIFSPPFNWLCEFLSTIALVLGVNMLVKQEVLNGDTGKTLQPFYIGMFITLLCLGLGGPTGLSVNPARDLGPRIAHNLLPIPNKGPSEWWYGWVPPTAALAGGACAACLFMAIKALDRWTE